jgi:transcription elongation factor Elf1
MQIKVYSPNGKELSIHAEKLNECPLCNKLVLIENINENEEGVNLFCYNCNLEFTSFSLRNFIKLRGFKEL